MTGAGLAAGCAKKASEVAPAYVSPARYMPMECPMLDEEVARLAARVAAVSKDQDDAATRDAIVTGVGLVLFWPALAVLAVQDSDEELALLKGEYQALDTARIQKRCPPPGAPAPALAG
jgi:hypothetical protein